ncbi:MAG: Hsp70 family protein [Syntrophomonadaceae bacterium]|jgi:molecular chaperone DnaK
MAMHLGIDFGTSYTKLGYWENDRLINLAGEGESIPTAVTYLPSTDSLYFGPAALRLQAPGACCARFFKLYLKRNLSFRLGPFDLPHIVAAFFTFLKKEYVEPRKQTVESVTIGIPNYFGLKARRLLVEAISACFEVERVNMLLEPVAAALGSRLINPAQPVQGDVLCVDIGGGTTDFSFLTINPNQNRLILETQLQTGHDIFSGSEVDHAILRNIIYPAFQIQTGQHIVDSLGQDKSLPFYQNFKLNQMLRQAENLKLELGESSSAYLHIPDFYAHQSLILDVDRELFAHQMQPLFKRLKDYIDSSLQSRAARLGLYDSGKWNLDHLLLVGGASLTLGIRELFSSIFGDVDIIFPANRELNVLAGLCAWEVKQYAPVLPGIESIYPFKFFIERYDPERQSFLLDKLPFDTVNLPLDTERQYKIFTLTRDSIYNLSPDPAKARFRIYELQEQDDNVRQRFTDRELVLEIEALKEELPEYTDIYLNLAQAQLHTSMPIHPAEPQSEGCSSFLTQLSHKQMGSYLNYQKFNHAHPDLLKDYYNLLCCPDKDLPGLSPSHFQAALLKLYTLIHILKN